MLLEHPGALCVPRLRFDTVSRAYCGPFGTLPRLLAVGAVGLCIAGSIRHSPLRLGLVCGESMEPTLPAGSMFVYNRESYRCRPPSRGDIVVVRIGRETWVKRVYAAGGATLWALRLGHEPGAPLALVNPAHRRRFASFSARLLAQGIREFQLARIRVPESKLFLVGDGQFSVDSRAFGPVDASRVLGRVIAICGVPARRLAVWSPARVEKSYPPPPRRGRSPEKQRA